MRSRTVWDVLRVVAVALLALALVLTTGCKKKDVAKAVAEQAAAEAAEALSVSDDVTPDEIGIGVYPGAVRDGTPVKDALGGDTGSVAQARYSTGAPYDLVVAFYRVQLEGGSVSEVTGAKGLRSVTVTRDEASDLEISTRCATISDAGGGRTEIDLSAVRRQATFAVYLNSVADADKEAVVSAICEWKAVPETAKEAEVQRQDVGKLMTVLPRPVEPSLSRDDAQKLAGALEAAGGRVEIR